VDLVDIKRPFGRTEVRSIIREIEKDREYRKYSLLIYRAQ